MKAVFWQEWKGRDEWELVQKEKGAGGGGVVIGGSVGN